ncbi:MAG: BBE domain-containing protein [Candidatus Acidiferrales bacterium]
MRRFSSGGLYLNFAGFGEDEDLVRRTYGNNYDQLRDLKKKYDPTNLFRLTQTNKPKA